jgi:hypothetical protein
MVVRKPALAAVLLTALLGAGACAYFLSATPARSATDPPASQTASYVASYAALQSVATSADQMPSAAGLSDVTEARLVSVSTDPSPAWLATTSSGQLCVVVGASGGSGCVAESALASGTQLLIVGESVGATPSEPLTQAQIQAENEAGPPPPQVIAGVAPNGVSTVSVTYSNGTSTTAPVKDNGFEISPGGRSPVAFSWTDAAGTQHSQTSGGAS